MYFHFVIWMMYLQSILVFSFVNYEPASYGKYIYPLWADSVGWLLTMSSVIPIFVVAIYKYVKADGDTVLEVSTHDVLAHCAHV